MTILLRCPGCLAELSVRDDFAQRAIRCPRCRTTVTVTPAPQPSFAEAIQGHGASARKETYLPCPHCGTPDPVRVVWTWWGSIYGPAAFHHVACRACKRTYNGRTGGSNHTVAAVFVIVPLVLILVIVFAGWWLLEE